jgi:hypothetical protein
VNPKSTIFQRLTQLVEDAAAKFRELIEKQHAVMGERQLSWARDGTATNEGRG